MFSSDFQNYCMPMLAWYDQMADLQQALHMPYAVCDQGKLLGSFIE
jgi:hypothetical protein